MHAPRFSLLALVLALSSPSPVAQNLIRDGDFEPNAATGFPEAPLDGPRRTAIDAPRRTPVGAWTVIRGGQGQNPGIKVVSKKYWRPKNGDQSIELNGTDGRGVLYQVFEADVEACHKVTFHIAANPDAGPAVKRMAVYWTEELPGQGVFIKGPGVLAGVFSFPSNRSTSGEHGNMNWQACELKGLKGRGRKTTLWFESEDDGGGGMALDDVRVVEDSSAAPRGIAFDKIEVTRDVPAPAPNYNLIARPVGDGPFKDLLNGLPGSPASITFAGVRANKIAGLPASIYGDFGIRPIDKSYNTEKRKPWRSPGFKYGVFCPVRIEKQGAPRETATMTGCRFELTCPGDEWDWNLCKGGNAFPNRDIDGPDLYFSGGEIGAPAADHTGTWLWMGIFPQEPANGVFVGNVTAPEGAQASAAPRLPNALPLVGSFENAAVSYDAEEQLLFASTVRVGFAVYINEETVFENGPEETVIGNEIHIAPFEILGYSKEVPGALELSDSAIAIGLGAIDSDEDPGNDNPYDLIRGRLSECLLIPIGGGKFDTLIQATVSFREMSLVASRFMGEVCYLDLLGPGDEKEDRQLTLFIATNLLRDTDYLAESATSCGLVQVCYSVSSGSIIR